VFSVEVAKKTFLLHREFTRAHHFPLGRGTRCFVAYDEESDRAVVLKDSWRDEAYEDEGKVYEKLKNAGVPNLFNVVAYGDVKQGCDFQRVTFKYKGRLGQEKKKVLCHSRLVLDRVGRSLADFRTERELVVAVRDALMAHKEAFEKTGILHRDISAGNIVLNAADADEGGFLIDWESAKTETMTDPGMNERMGTYQFLSIRLLEDMGNPVAAKHELQDDLESFVWVLYWMAAKYAPTTADDQNRMTLEFFDDPDPKRAARLKKLLIRDPDCAQELRLKSRSLTTLLDAMMGALSCYRGGKSLKSWVDPYDASGGPNGSTKYSADMGSHDLMLRLFNDALKTEVWT
ncbi:hypothetical protein BT69DRAFT_1227752, partial [Atractiella rhizophila]